MRMWTIRHQFTNAWIMNNVSYQSDVEQQQDNLQRAHPEVSLSSRSEGLHPIFLLSFWNCPLRYFLHFIMCTTKCNKTRICNQNICSLIPVWVHLIRLYDRRLFTIFSQGWEFGRATNTFAFRRVSMCSFPLQAYPRPPGYNLLWPRYSASNAFLDFSPHTFYTKVQFSGSNIELTCRVFSLLFVVPHWPFPTEDVFNSKLCDMGWNLCVKVI